MIGWIVAHKLFRDAWELNKMAFRRAQARCEGPEERWTSLRRQERVVGTFVLIIVYFFPRSIVVNVDRFVCFLSRASGLCEEDIIQSGRRNARSFIAICSASDLARPQQGIEGLESLER